MSLKRRNAGISDDFMRKAKRPRLNPGTKSQVRALVKQALDSEIELKKHDTTVDITASDTGTVVDLSNMIQDVGVGERVGQKVKPKSLDVRLSMIHADSTQVIRLILFQWHQDTSVFTPGASVLLDPVALAAGSFGATTAPYNDTNRGLFRIISDRTFTSVTAADTAVVHWKRKFSPELRHIEYNDSSLEGTEKLWLLAVSDSTAIAHPAVFGHIRLNYTDS